MPSRQIDETQLQTLHAQGHSQAEIARLLGVPKSTVYDRVKKLAQAPPPEPTPQVSTSCIPPVDTGSVATMTGDVLQEVVAWWRDRTAALQQAQEEGRTTRRVTFFVEKRWEEAIRRQADIDGWTYTQVVNEAFHRYFSGK